MWPPRGVRTWYTHFLSHTRQQTAFWSHLTLRPTFFSPPPPPPPPHTHTHPTPPHTFCFLGGESQVYIYPKPSQRVWSQIFLLPPSSRCGPISFQYPISSSSLLPSLLAWRSWRSRLRLRRGEKSAKSEIILLKPCSDPTRTLPVVKQRKALKGEGIK